MKIDQEILSTIALENIKGVGPIMARKLIEHFGSAKDIFDKSSRTQDKSLLPGAHFVFDAQIQQRAMDEAREQIQFVEQNDIEVLHIDDMENYPSKLRECVDAPLILYTRKNCELNHRPILSIVGTRSSTRYGADIIEELISELSRQLPRLIVVSGLAYGIDITAHQAALSHGLDTLGILAHGLDRIYPFAHRNTAKKMVEQGGLITEYGAGTIPERGNFLARNRIVAGIADAVVIIESAEKGGSLVTANIANSYARDVFAFPGRISDKKSLGCNNLIRQNKAALIRSADDLMEMMNWQTLPKKDTQMQIAFEYSDQEKIIADMLLINGDMQINRMAVESDMPVSSLLSLLMDMEIKGMARSLPGGMYQLCARS